jgi:polysaccharide export outer membrane protein
MQTVYVTEMAKLYKYLMIFLLIVCQSCRIEKAPVFMENFRPENSIAFKNISDSIRVGDVLSIHINNLGKGTLGVSQVDEVSCKVRSDGTSELPYVGFVKVVNWSLDSLQAYLNKNLKEYLSNPYVQVLYKNYKITVLSSAGKSTVLNAETGKFNLIDAVNAFNNFNNNQSLKLRVLRINGDSTVLASVDMSNKESFQSPFFQLKQNDVVIIDDADSEIKKKRFEAFLSKAYPYLLSTLLVLLTRLL